MVVVVPLTAVPPPRMLNFTVAHGEVSPSFVQAWALSSPALTTDAPMAPAARGDEASWVRAEDSWLPSWSREIRAATAEAEVFPRSKMVLNVVLIAERSVAVSGVVVWVAPDVGVAAVDVVDIACVVVVEELDELHAVKNRPRLVVATRVPTSRRERPRDVAVGEVARRATGACSRIMCFLRFGWPRATGPFPHSKHWGRDPGGPAPSGASLGAPALGSREEDRETRGEVAA